jgi:hypothetical protein
MLVAVEACSAIELVDKLRTDRGEAIKDLNKMRGAQRNVCPCIFSRRNI